MADFDPGAATFRIGAAQAERLPRFTLTGQYGRQSAEFQDVLEDQSEIYQTIGGISIPLFTGGRLGRQVDIERARAEQARARCEQTVLVALQEVDAALADLRYQNGVPSSLGGGWPVSAEETDASAPSPNPD